MSTTATQPEEPANTSARMMSSASFRGSTFLSNLHYFLAQTDGSYHWPPAATGDLLRQAKTEIEAMAAERAKPEPPPHPQQIKQLIKERDGWCDKAREYVGTAQALHSQLDTLRKFQKPDTWIWQGDGEDHLESMANDMVVVIRAAALRQLIAEATAHQHEQTRAACLRSPPGRAPLSMDRITAIAQGMPGGLDGFMKGWGWYQFTRAIEAEHGIGIGPDLPPNWPPKLGELRLANGATDPITARVTDPTLESCRQCGAPAGVVCKKTDCAQLPGAETGSTGDAK